MHKKCKLLLVGLLTILPVSEIFSQTRTFSPFSRYGIGEINNKGFGQNAAMGGTGIGLRTPYHLNSLNPAAYTAIDTLSFYFESGVSGFYQTLESAGNSNNFSEIDFDYFAFGFPVSKRFFASVGIKPASNAGYSFSNITGDGSDASLQKASGIGNLTNLYGGLGVKLSPNLSLGMHVSYWFGNIDHTAFTEFINDPDAYKFGTKNNIHLNDVLFDFGLQYSNITGKNNRYTLGFTFSPKTAMSGESTLLKARGYVYDEEGELFLPNDTLSLDKDKWNNKTFELPLGIGIGASYVFNDKLTLAADYTMRQWGDALFPDEDTETTNASYLNVGAEWVPKERTATKYYQRIRYRAGFHYTNDYIKLNGYQVKDFGMSFGLGLPLKRSNTSVNLVFEMGTKGTSQAGQMKEKYNRVTINFTMHEYWFIKRKFE